MRHRVHRWIRARYPECIGAVGISTFTFAVTRLGLLPKTYVLANGLLGGVVVGILTPRQDSGYFRGLLASVGAVALIPALAVIDDLVLTIRYDIVLTTFGRTPTGMLDQFLLYTVYEAIVVSPFVVLALLTGFIGGALGFELKLMVAEGRRS